MAPHLRIPRRSIPANPRWVRSPELPVETRELADVQAESKRISLEQADEFGMEWWLTPEACRVNWDEIDSALDLAIGSRLGYMDESVRELEEDRDIILWLQRRIYHIAIHNWNLKPRAVAKTPIPPEIRIQVMERDAYRCQDCGGWHDLAVDHIVPESMGGPTSLENLQVLCRSCNSRKGAS